MSADASILAEPIELGALKLSNRIVMAPMTRSRAVPGALPGASARLYYAQRASAGLIVTEGTCISAEAIGNPDVPGIWNDAQVAGWRPVVEAVHERGGRIVVQLWHTGRASIPVLQPNGQMPVGPSPIAIDGATFTHSGNTPFVTPRELATAEIPRIVADYARAAANARRAGFDGVELHGANGYLIDQFLQDGSNQRTDEYGGSIENRTLFLLEVVDAVSAAVDADRVGVRLSPSSTFQDVRDSDPTALWSHVLRTLSSFGLAYVHLVEPGISGGRTVARSADAIDSAWAHERYDGSIVTVGEHGRDSAVATLSAGSADAVGFARLFLANPDLPERLFAGEPLNVPVRETFYGGVDRGYIDYPSMEAEHLRVELLASLAAGEPLPEITPLGPSTPIDEWPLAWAAGRVAEGGAPVRRVSSGR